MDPFAPLFANIWIGLAVLAVVAVPVLAWFHHRAVQAAKPVNRFRRNR